MASAAVSASPSRWWLWVILAAAILAAFGVWRVYFRSAETSDKSASTSAPPPVPVTVAQARTADFPVYLTGLGVVEPYDTVTVSSRVDGEILKVDFKQGQMVKEGDVLAEIDPRPYQAAVDQAVAKKSADEANLKNAQLNLQRYTTLSKEDFSTKQQLDTQQATVDQLIAEIKGDQAAVDNAQTQLGYTTIRSPLTGKTSFRLVDPGNIVHASATTGIVTIVKLQPISVVFTAPEEQVPAINKALAAGAVPVTAMSSDGSTTLSQGHLSVVNNSVDQNSGDIRLKATFANADNALWPGLSVSTRLLVNTLKQVIVVPQDAVQRGPNGFYVYLVGDGEKAAIRQIKVDQEGDGLSVVTEGLTPGQSVVVEGQSRLRDGLVVQPNAATASAKAP